MSRKGKPQQEKGLEMAQQQCKALWSVATRNGKVHRDNAAKVLKIQRASLSKLYSKFKRYRLEPPTLFPEANPGGRRVYKDDQLPTRRPIGEPFDLKHSEIRYVNPNEGQWKGSNKDEGSHWITMLM